jgi:transcriptional regulator with XRE-family HTH domain
MHDTEPEKLELLEKVSAEISRRRTVKGSEHRQLTELARIVTRHSGTPVDIGLVWNIQLKTMGKFTFEEVQMVDAALTAEFDSADPGPEGDGKAGKKRRRPMISEGDARQLREIGERISQRLADLSLREAEAAKLIGMSRVYLVEITKGLKGHRPSVVTYSKISDVLGVSLDWLMNGRSSSTSAEAEAMAANIMALSKRDRGLLRSLIRAMKAKETEKTVEKDDA